MKPSNPVQNQCKCKFPPARAQRTRYAITLHVALCFHRRRRTPGPRAWPLSTPPGMACWRGGHALRGTFPRCGARDWRRPAARHTYKRSDGCRCYSVTHAGRCAGRKSRATWRSLRAKKPRKMVLHGERRAGQFGAASAGALRRGHRLDSPDANIYKQFAAESEARDFRHRRRSTRASCRWSNRSLSRRHSSAGGKQQ